MDAAGDQNQVQPYVKPASDKGNDEGASGKGLQQFHAHHSPNIQLKNDSTLACVLSCDSGYESGIMYSKQPLTAGDLFLVEIEKTDEKAWGVIMMGLTKEKPCNNAASFLNMLPLHLRNRWLHRVYADECARTLRDQFSENIIILPREEEQCGSMNMKTAQLGIIYKPSENNATRGALHFLNNGVDVGPADTVDSLGAGPLYVMMNVQGSVKQVRIIQKNTVLSLKNACRSVIRDNFTKDAIMKLQLPAAMKSFLLTRDY